MTYNYSATPVRITDDCGDGTLVCPVCGGGNLHPVKVHEIVGDGAIIPFSCEQCSMSDLSLAETVGSLHILFHKGTTFVSWEVDPAFADTQRVAEHDALMEEYYQVLTKLRALRKPVDSFAADLRALTEAWSA